MDKTLLVLRKRLSLWDAAQAFRPADAAAFCELVREAIEGGELVPLEIVRWPGEFDSDLGCHNGVGRINELETSIAMTELRRWCDSIGLSLEPPASEVAQEQTAQVSSSTRESTEQRQARRYQMCISAGLKMPNSDYAPLPRGIGSLAERERIARQSFAEDVKAHIRRLNGR